MMRGLPIVIVAALLVVSSVAWGDITYVYDENDRLTTVIDPDAAQPNAAIYSYDAVGNLLSIARSDSSVLSILGFSPSCASVGSTVSIYGLGFAASPTGNTVGFNGVASSAAPETPYKLVTTVPAGATTGLLSVTTGVGTAYSAQPFTVGCSGPQITTLQPDLADPGAAVTILGTNFQAGVADNRVTFHDQLAEVSAASATQIESKVPLLATTGYVFVTTPFGTAQSPGHFYVPPTGILASNIQYHDDVNLNFAPPDTYVWDGSSGTFSTATRNGLFAFEGQQGWDLAAEYNVSSSTYFLLRNPSGEVENQGLGNASIHSTRFPALADTGTYVLHVDPTVTGSAFDFTLYAFNDYTGTQISPGGAVDLNIRVPTQNPEALFQGTAAQPITVRFDWNVNNFTHFSGGSLCFVARIFEGSPPGGIQRAASPTDCLNPLTFSTTLQNAGPHRVRVDTTHTTAVGPVHVTLTSP